ncbi:MAG: methyltransferase domain-containing protein [Balneola sp.]|jgi:malonyl-CoA O-methyltransferase
MKITAEQTISSKSIAETFSEAAEQYHQKAEIQQKVANGLISSLLPWKDTLPAGDILEVGCGTGFLSEQLIKEFPERRKVITDLAPGMLSFCEEQLTEKGLINDSVYFQRLNVDEISETEPKYSLIVSNFAAQWFKDTSIGLEKLTELLVPGGLLLCTFPGNHTFEEWYSNCLELGLPYTANALPDVEEVVIKLSMNPVQVDYYENDLFQEFDQSLDFFKHLKEIGVRKSKTGKQLSVKQLKILTDFWDEKEPEGIKVKWHVVYLAAKKDM